MQLVEADLKDALNRYHTLLDQLEAYPEWKEKLVE